ncbi:MAG: MoxR family ATPase [Candidatus Abyssobacteria bacterium SURF_17]|uniref:MoxR family ATPase n=1 Tax=Candidatus Abyssobacteria bacterium SURF_17 TaxID=2093361 RepID=A0A419EN33_9BACT|nr:MAG: MoxR family ATPase [Candidatus Abyssubacteria bacterium SURF_17]
MAIKGLTKATESVRALEENISLVIFGKQHVVQQALAALLARGHLLIEDVPGIGKTTLARAIARSIDCTFQRIQFTSDLLPSDIIGVTIYNQHTHQFEFKAGPIFANVILADEINRTTPKTQSCLLEAMNEMQVSVDSVTYPLPQPFLVLATQNPIEFHGTYPLPESQLDRFMLKIRIGYPPSEDEKKMITGRQLTPPVESLQPVIHADDVRVMQAMVTEVSVDSALVNYLMAIVEATRHAPAIELGVSPRGAMNFYRAAQANALVMGRDYCVPDDIKEMAVPCLSHRIIPATRLDVEGPRTEAAERAIAEILNQTPVPL